MKVFNRKMGFSRYFLCILLFGFLIFSNSCTNTIFQNDSICTIQPDTIPVYYIRYAYFDSPPQVIQNTLIKNTIADSIVTFRYYEDTILSEKYVFTIQNNSFELIQDSSDMILIAVDTFQLYLMNENHSIYKYEILNPPIDGSGGFLFNEKYGLLGYCAYSWTSKVILTQWGDINIENEMSKLLDKENKYLSPSWKHIPPPPPEKTIEIY